MKGVSAKYVHFRFWVIKRGKTQDFSDSVREGVPLILGDLNDPKQNTNIILLGTYLWNNNKKKSVNF